MNREPELSFLHSLVLSIIVDFVQIISTGLLTALIMIDKNICASALITILSWYMRSLFMVLL